MVLTASRIDQIESIANDLIKDAYRDENIVPPIDVGRIIQNSGLTLLFGPFAESDIDGYYDRMARTISLKEDAPYVRQVFTAAHELGHFYLHQDKTQEIFYRRDAMLIDAGDKVQEQEANWFAASLLMPKTVISKYWYILGDIDDIAERFGVSSTAAFWRLKNLGLLG